MEDRISQLPRSVAALEKLERALQRLEMSAGRQDGDLFAARPQPVKDEGKGEMRQALTVMENRVDGLVGRLERLLGE